MGHVCPLCLNRGWFGYGDRCSACIDKCHTIFCDTLYGWCHSSCSYVLPYWGLKRLRCNCEKDEHPPFNAERLSIPEKTKRYSERLEQLARQVERIEYSDDYRDVHLHRRCLWCRKDRSTDEEWAYLFAHIHEYKADHHLNALACSAECAVQLKKYGWEQNE